MPRHAEERIDGCLNLLERLSGPCARVYRRFFHDRWHPGSTEKYPSDTLLGLSWEWLGFLPNDGKGGLS